MAELVLRRPCEECGSGANNWTKPPDHNHMVVYILLDPDRRLFLPGDYDADDVLTVADVLAALGEDD